MTVIGIENRSDNIVYTLGLQLVVPFAHDRIDKNIKYGRGRNVALCCTSFGSNWVAIVSLLSSNDRE
jgi:hypothetical protein